MTGAEPDVEILEDAAPMRVNPLVEFWLDQQEEFQQLVHSVPEVAVTQIEEYMRAIRIGRQGETWMQKFAETHRFQSLQIYPFFSIFE